MQYEKTGRGSDGVPAEKSEMLWHAAWDGDAAEVWRLLAGPNGAKPDEPRGSNCETALLMASRLGNTSVVRVLLGAGADPEIKASDGNTALIWASYKGRLPVVKLLLRHGVDWSATDKSGKTALSWAQRWGHVEVAVALLAVEREAEAEAARQKKVEACTPEDNESLGEGVKFVAAAEI